MNSFQSNKKLTSQQLEEITVLMARAFQYDPMLMYVFPESKKRANRLLRHFYHLIKYGIITGQIQTLYSSDHFSLAGGAIWLPPLQRSFSYLPLFQAGWLPYLCSLSFGELKRLYHMFDCMESMHQALIIEPHWYLIAIGVDPIFQGKGLGSKALKEMLSVLDQEHQKAYLETGNFRDIALYERHGFQIVQKRSLDSATQVWAMIRDPQPI